MVEAAIIVSHSGQGHWVAACASQRLDAFLFSVQFHPRHVHGALIPTIVSNSIVSARAPPSERFYQLAPWNLTFRRRRHALLGSLVVTHGDPGRTNCKSTLLSNERVAEQKSGPRMVATVVLVKALRSGWLIGARRSPTTMTQDVSEPVRFDARR
jgi:hypothetical protein